MFLHDTFEKRKGKYPSGAYSDVEGDLVRQVHVSYMKDLGFSQSKGKPLEFFARLLWVEWWQNWIKNLHRCGCLMVIRLEGDQTKHREQMEKSLSKSKGEVMVTWSRRLAGRL